jgi:hypothetical protein
MILELSVAGFDPTLQLISSGPVLCEPLKFRGYAQQEGPLRLPYVSNSLTAAFFGFFKHVHVLQGAESNGD